MRRALVAAVLLAGCGGEDSTGPSVPNVAGTYHGQIILNAIVTVVHRLAQEAVSVTLDQSDDQVIVGVVAASGAGLTSTGTVFPGGALDLNEPDIGAFAAAFPQCSFTQAHASTSAAAVGNRLVMTGSIIGACPLQSGGQLVQTTFDLRIDATR